MPRVTRLLSKLSRTLLPATTKRPWQHSNDSKRNPSRSKPLTRSLVKRVGFLAPQPCFRCPRMDRPSCAAFHPQRNHGTRCDRRRMWISNDAKQMSSIFLKANILISSLHAMFFLILCNPLAQQEVLRIAPLARIAAQASQNMLVLERFQMLLVFSKPIAAPATLSLATQSWARAGPKSSWQIRPRSPFSPFLSPCLINIHPTWRGG